MASFRLPDYSLVNFGLTWRNSWKLIGNDPISTTIYLNINNLFNEKYIERGKDGSGHTLESFRGYWGFGTNCNLGIRINL
jgi:outer membrane receptor protein involved in Fe transport